MRAKPVHARLDERRAAAGARSCDRRLHRILDRQHVRAVHFDGRHLVGGRPLVDDAGRRLSRRQRRLHGVEVVLAEEDHRHLLERGEVQALGGDALFGRRVAEEHDDDSLLAFQLRGKRRADGDRNGAADDRRCPRHPDALVDQVHRAASRSGAPVHAAVHLAQHRFQIAALGQIGAVRAVARVDEIGGRERRAASDGGRFLADHQVNRRLHLVLVIAAFDLFLDAPDAEHRAVEPGQVPLVARGGVPGRTRRRPRLCMGIGSRGHNPSGWYSAMRHPDMSNLKGTVISLRSALRPRGRGLRA